MVELLIVCFTPAHDIQAIFRTYRFGQKKPVYVYRFVASGTMEERVYERQIIKESLSKRVIDEKQIERHFSKNELQELYRFEPRKEQTETKTPKDMLLACLLRGERTKHLIHAYHEHDSLLENRPEDSLTEAERQNAWQEYEQERNMSAADRHALLMNQHQQQMQEERARQMRAYMVYQQQLYQQQLQQQQQNGTSSSVPSILQRSAPSGLSVGSYSSQPSASAILQMLQVAQQTGNIQQLQQLVQAYPILSKFLPQMSSVMQQTQPEAPKARVNPAQLTLSDLYTSIKGSVQKDWTIDELCNRANAILNQSYRQAQASLSRLNKSVG